MSHKIVFVGQLRWYYRGKAVLSALKTLWMALRGYHPAVLSE